MWSRCATAKLQADSCSFYFVRQTVIYSASRWCIHLFCIAIYSMNAWASTIHPTTIFTEVIRSAFNEKENLKYKLKKLHYKKYCEKMLHTNGGIWHNWLVACSEFRNASCLAETRFGSVWQKSWLQVLSFAWMKHVVRAFGRNISASRIAWRGNQPLRPGKLRIPFKKERPTLRITGLKYKIKACTLEH